VSPTKESAVTENPESILEALVSDGDAPGRASLSSARAAAAETIAMAEEAAGGLRAEWERAEPVVSKRIRILDNLLGATQGNLQRAVDASRQQYRDLRDRGSKIVAQLEKNLEDIRAVGPGSADATGVIRDLAGRIHLAIGRPSAERDGKTVVDEYRRDALQADNAFLALAGQVQGKFRASE